MKILICQPKLETDIVQLQNEISSHNCVDLVVFPEGYLNDNVERACQLAKAHCKTIITGYKKPKDRAIMIHSSGRIALDRAKYSPYRFVEVSGLKTGIILCDELVLQRLEEQEALGADLILHPIGVGMFSEEQFAEWIGKARNIAVKHRTMVIGTSHADGSFRGSDVSIPIAYGFDREGRVVFIAKNDVRTRILDTDTMRMDVI